MGDVLNVALSGLLAYQQALTTTGHNITNANTAGYSRQIAKFGTQQGPLAGGLAIGAGVRVEDISRVYDKYVAMDLNDSTSRFNELSIYNDFAGRIDGLLGDANSGIAAGLQEFFGSLQTLSATPASQPARSGFLSQSQLLVNRFQTLYNQLDQQENAINQEVRNLVSRINSLAQSIAGVNARIQGAGSNVSPDLFDQRDVFLNQLSELVTVSTNEQPDGAVNVLIGTGQPLVVAGTYNSLTTSASEADPSQTNIAISTSSGNIDITSSIQGGKIGGTLNFRDEVLGATKITLGRLALGLADTFNDQHHLGMDFNGDLGGDFFLNINDSSLTVNRSITNANNTGTATMAVSITNVNSLVDSNYRLTVTAGPNYSLLRLSDNTTFTSATLPISADGFSVALNSGVVAVGDTFLIQPTKTGANDIALNISSADQIAIAAPVRGSASLNNIGTGVISNGQVVNTGTTAFTTTPGALSPPITIEFLSATTYQIVNATTTAVIEGPIAYNPATENSIFPTPGAFDPGYRFTLKGAPEAGDTFDITYNSGGVSDNRNALSLLGLQSTKTLGSSTASYQDTYASLVSTVGLRTHESEVNKSVNETLLKQAQARREAVSGVNLDEEAANMLKLQQNYQAAAKLIEIAQSLFNTLLGTFG